MIHKVSFDWTRTKAIFLLDDKYRYEWLKERTDEELMDLGEKEGLWKIVNE